MTARSEDVGVTGQAESAGDDQTLAPVPTDEIDWSSESADQVAMDRRSVPGVAYENDPSFYKLVVNFVGVSLVVSILGIIVLAAGKVDVPQGLVAIGSGLVGLLSGIFVARQRI